MVDHRHVHRAQDAVRHRRGAGDLQEMAARGAGRILGHVVPSRDISVFWHINDAPGSLPFACRHQGRMRESNHGTKSEAGVLERNDRRATAAGAGTQAEGRDHGRRDVRPLQPRPLCDRRLALPDDAARRGRAAHGRGGRARACARARGGRERAAARRRHLAVRADRQRVAGHRLLEVPHRRSTRSTSASGAARSSPASCSTTSTASSSPTASGSRSTSRPPRARPSAA